MLGNQKLSRDCRKNRLLVEITIREEKEALEDQRNLIKGVPNN